MWRGGGDPGRHNAGGPTSGLCLCQCLRLCRCSRMHMIKRKHAVPKINCFSRPISLPVVGFKKPVGQSRQQDGHAMALMPSPCTPRAPHRTFWMFDRSRISWMLLSSGGKTDTRLFLLPAAFALRSAFDPPRIPLHADATRWREDGGRPGPAVCHPLVPPLTLLRAGRGEAQG